MALSKKLEIALAISAKTRAASEKISKFTSATEKKLNRLEKAGRSKPG